MEANPQNGRLNELYCSSDKRTFESIAAVTRETWLAPGTTSPSAFRNAFCGRDVLSYRHTIQLSAIPGHSRPPTTIGHYVHLISMSGSASDGEAIHSVSGPQRAVMTDISESNLRQLRRRSGSPGSTINDDIAVLIAYVPIQQRVAQLSANDPWQLPRLPRAAGTSDFSPQDLARFLERLADGITWSALATATSLPLLIQRRLCAALIQFHEVAPQAWFPKEQLIEFATTCAETRLVEDADLLDDRPCRNLPRGWLDEAVVSRLWEIGGNPNDPRHRGIITAAKILGAGANRRERLVPMACLDDLVVCAQALRLLEVEWSRIVIMLVTGYPASRIEAALADAGIEQGQGSFSKVPALPRVGAASVKLALALRVGIGEPSRLHVNTLAWGFGVLALWRGLHLIDSPVAVIH